MDPKPCEHCAEMFVPVRFATTRFCSRKCTAAQYGAQYRQDNKERLAQYKAQWRLDNPEYQAQYRQQVQAGFGFYLDMFVNEEGNHYYRGPLDGSRLKRLSRDLRAAREATLEVRLSNLAARRLYEKYGFRPVGIRPRYYSDNNEDALIMTTEPLELPAMVERLARLRAALDASPAPSTEPDELAAEAQLQ